MTKEAHQFFEKHFGNVEKFYTAGARRGLSRQSVKRACQIIYDIHAEHPYRSLTILGQRVFATAKTIHIEKEETTDDRINAIEETLGRHLRPWWKKVLDWYVGKHGENNPEETVVF